MVVGNYHDNGSVIEPRVWNASLARLALNKGLPFIQPKSPRNLQFINDIQSIEVLKDGGALYGVRGSGGLIVITTRHPESVTTKVNFSAHTGVTMQPVNLNVLGSNQYKTYLVNQLQNSGQVFSEILQENPWVSGNPSYYYYYNYDNETDWQNEIFRPAYTGKFNVNLEGGDEIARFAVMLGYLDQQGTVENTRYQRYKRRRRTFSRSARRRSE